MTDSGQDVADILAQGSFEMIEPPKDLQAKVKPRSGRHRGPADPVAEAEKALERLSTNFNVWMQDEINALQSALDELKSAGPDVGVVKTFHRSAHDIKGQAATLGYPIAGHVAGSLCRLLEGTENHDQLPLELVEQHVQAVRAIVSEKVKSERDTVANALADRLNEVTTGFLASLPGAQA